MVFKLNLHRIDVNININIVRNMYTSLFLEYFLELFRYRYFLECILLDLM